MVVLEDDIARSLGSQFIDAKMRGISDQRSEPSQPANMFIGTGFDPRDRCLLRSRMA